MGVSPLSLDGSKLFTVLSDSVVEIQHEAVDGVFDNRDFPMPPTAIFDAKTPATEEELLTFDASSSYDDGWIVSYEWDFDYDGMTFDVDAMGKIAFNAYDLEGTYTAALRVTDNDGETTIASQDIQVLVWIEGGTFPDLVQKSAWPEKPKWWEASDGALVPFNARIGNPTSESYDVYAEFTLLSKDEAKMLGKIETTPQPIGGGEILDVVAMLDLNDNTWTAFSGSPEWVPYGYYGAGGMRKYQVFAKCYYDDGTGFKLGDVAKYFHFNVYPAKHDIGVEMWTSANEVAQGGSLEIYANITNKGSLSETFVASVTYKGELAEGIIEERPMTLAPGDIVTETFVWDTDALPLGPYILKATLPTPTYELPRTTPDQEDLAVVYIV